MNSQIVLPAKIHAIHPHQEDAPYLDQARHLIDNFLFKFKYYRAIATSSNPLARNARQQATLPLLSSGLIDDTPYIPVYLAFSLALARFSSYWYSGK